MNIQNGVWLRTAGEKKGKKGAGGQTVESGREGLAIARDHHTPGVIVEVDQVEYLPHLPPEAATEGRKEVVLVT